MENTEEKSQLVEQVESVQETTDEVIKPFDANAFAEEVIEKVDDGSVKSADQTETETADGEMTWDDITLEEEESEEEEEKEIVDEDWDVEEKEESEEETDNKDINWQDVGKSLGLKTGSKEDLINAINEAVNDSKQKPQPVQSDSIKMINDLLKLTDREIMTEELKADGMDEYDIDETLDKMEDSGTLKRESVRIKKQLKNALKQESNRITESKVKEENSRVEALSQNKQDLQKHLKGVDTYFGGKVSGTDKKDLYKYITSGNFNDEIYDSHENVAEVAWMWKNKEKIKKILFSEGFEKGKAHIFNKITSPSTNRANRPNTKIKTGKFDASEFMKE